MFDRKKSDKKYYENHRERCRDAERRYRNKPEVRERLLEKQRERSKQWYANPENRLRRKKYNKDWWQRKIKELEEMVGRSKPSKCEICGGNGQICFDHCHKTGKARGWICMNCNTILGKVNDDVEILKKLINYLNSVK
jgi:hypothetical protein